MWGVLVRTSSNFTPTIAFSTSLQPLKQNFSQNHHHNRIRTTNFNIPYYVSPSTNNTTQLSFINKRWFSDDTDFLNKLNDKDVHISGIRRRDRGRMGMKNVNSEQKSKIIETTTKSRFNYTDKYLSYIQPKGNPYTSENLTALEDYHRTIDQYVKTSRYKEITRLYEQMHKHGVFPTPKTYLMLMRGCQRTGKYIIAETFMNFTRFDGFKPLPNAFCCLMLSYFSANRLDEVETVFERAVKLYPPDQTLFMTIIRIYCAKNDFEKIEKYYNKMLEASIEPNELILISIGFAYKRAGQGEKAEEYFNQLKKYNIKLSLDYWNRYFKHLSANENVSVKVEEGLQAMENSGVKPTISTINTIIMLFVIANNIERVDYYFGLLQDLKIRPNVRTFSCVIMTCSKKEDLPRLRSIIDLFKTYPFRPTVYLLQNVLVYCNKIKDFELAQEFFNLWWTSVLPRKGILNIMIGLAPNEESAIYYYRFFDLWEIRPDDVTFIKLFKNVQSSDGLELLFSDIKRLGIIVSPSLSTAIFEYTGIDWVEALSHIQIAEKQKDYDFDNYYRHNYGDDDNYVDDGDNYVDGDNNNVDDNDDDQQF